jgi:hypothetical protein
MASAQKPEERSAHFHYRSKPARANAVFGNSDVNRHGSAEHLEGLSEKLWNIYINILKFVI